MSSAPIRRTTARVVPVNRQGEVLLLHGRDPERPGLRYWFTIGGEIDPGESLPEAGTRELREETGIAVRPGDLVGPFHRGRHDFSWNGWDFANDSHYFALRVDDVEVSFDGLEELEVGNVLDARWWRPADLSGDEGDTEDLPTISRLAVAAVGL